TGGDRRVLLAAAHAAAQRLDAGARSAALGRAVLALARAGPAGAVVARSRSIRGAGNSATRRVGALPYERRAAPASSAAVQAPRRLGRHEPLRCPRPRG